jgi:hypothetical protein
VKETTDSTIEVIDGALRDAVVSPDAMRWSPEPQPRSLQPAYIREAGAYTFQLPRGVRPARPPRPAFTADTIAAVGLTFAEFARAFQAFARAVGAAMRKVRPAVHIVQHADRSSIRCHICNPFANPKPLVFGPAYRRRQLARRKARRHG